MKGEMLNGAKPLKTIAGLKKAKEKALKSSTQGTKVPLKNNEKEQQIRTW